MRCGCPQCGTFMIQKELGACVCVCPECGYRCDACLGTGTALTREALARLRNTDWITPHFDAEPEDGLTDVEDPNAPEEF